MKKKIYIIPTATTVAVNVVTSILDGSLAKGSATVEGTAGGWTKEDNADWNDIWSE
ncbi:MAG: hypothetical protein IJ700_08165 [Bacteroidaceae bacterium]|nr:hypothetical protein [Bacteroidaceae bacterium]